MARRGRYLHEGSMPLDRCRRAAVSGERPRRSAASQERGRSSRDAHGRRVARVGCRTPPPGHDAALAAAPDEDAERSPRGCRHAPIGGSILADARRHHAHAPGSIVARREAADGRARQWASQPRGFTQWSRGHSATASRARECGARWAGNLRRQETRAPLKRRRAAITSIATQGEQQSAVPRSLGAVCNMSNARRSMEPDGAAAPLGTNVVAT
jgi:hypothetical protein